MFFKICSTGRKETVYVCHRNGSQNLYAAIQDLVGDTPCPVNDIPYCLEVDGWGDDQAAEGDVYEGDGFTVECISEDEYREETGQLDTPVWRLV